jgi:alanine racemase
LTRRIDSLLSDGGLPPLERSAWVEVDVDILTANASALGALAAPRAVAAVVKADGYGHGLEMAGRCAISGGAGWLCVADSGEAARLRGDGYPGPVFVLYPVPPSAVSRMARLGVDITVGSIGEARALDGLLGADEPVLGVHLEIDTGMTRGGVEPESAVEAASALTPAGATRLAGVWTHLAAPENPETTAEQLSRFSRALSQIRAAGIPTGLVHAAASGGLLAVDTGSHDFVRPGLAFYGLHPAAGSPLPDPVRPALTVRALPIRLAGVPVGTSVGYAGTWTAERESTIATLPIGYADGWSRASSPGTDVLVEGRRAPLVGRVSSDSITADVTGVPAVRPDSQFTLLGRDGDEEITADEVAEVRRTISWEVLQQLGARLARVYMSGPTAIALRPESTIQIEYGAGRVAPGY